MSSMRFSFVLMIFLVLVSQFLVFTTFADVSEDEATSALANAESAVVSGYQAVLEIEEAGENVSVLLAQLNEAGELLAKAQVAYRLRDFEEVVRSANLCSEIGKSVKNEADELRVKAYGPRVMGLWFTMTGSLVGVVAVGLGSFWSWRFFKRRYYRRVLKMKPEVVEVES